jgi:4-hydroxy-tetrahydrodipicolinate synthase
MRPASTFVVSITPFTADDELDEVALRAHLRRLAASGIGVYLAGSGSGEGYTLSTDEVRRVLEIGVEELAGRVPVRAMGVEPRTARDMIGLGRLAADVGVDALQVYALDQGHGNHPTTAELERYVFEVMDAVALPVVLSTHRAVGYLLPVDLIGQLLDRYDAIVGVNCSSPDHEYLVRVIDVVAGRADVHVGGPMQALSCLALGGQGFLSSEGNLTPRLCVSLVDAHGRGDLATRDAVYGKLLRLYAATRRLGGITATKAALHALGLPGGVVRRPRLPADADAGTALVQLLDALDVRASEGVG